VLEVVVEGEGELVAGLPDATEQGVVLAVVPQQPDAAHPGVFSGELLDHGPGAGAAVVVREDQLVRPELARQHRSQTQDRLRTRRRTS